MTQATELISAARSYADTMVAAADEAMGDAIGAAGSIFGAPSIPFTGIGLPDAPEALGDMEAPALDDVQFDPGESPGAELTFQDIGDIDTAGAPTNSARLPYIDERNTPSALTQFSVTLPPLDLGVRLPSAPDLIMPPDVVITDRTIGDAPVVQLPSFEGSRPQDISAPPSGLDVVLQNAYSVAVSQFVSMADAYVDAELAKLNPQYQSQMARIEEQLTKYLDGGTGLKPAVENAIYERARGKNDAEARRVRDQALADAATRGFTIPTGALLSATQQARQAGADANARAAAEIVVMQAEMEQKNLQFAVTTSTGLRTAMVNATMGYLQSIVALNGQAASHAQSVVNAIVETYNAVVRAYTAKLEGYKADAQVFQVRMQAALAGIEVYKAEVQALMALTQVDMAKVNVYRARIDALTAQAAMYKTAVEAVVSKASLEKLKVDVFQAQVQAFSAQVGAKNAEWQGYVAQIQGDNAKVQAYNSQVQAYATEVQGYKAKIEAQAEAVKAEAMTNDARAKQYVAQWEGYKAIVAAKGEIARTQLENQRQEVVAFQAETSAKVAKYNAGVEFYKATANIGIANAKGLTEISIKNAELEMSYGKTLATLHSANASIHANLAGAAMAGMNALAVETATDA